METWRLRHRKTSGTSQLSKEFVSSTCAQLVSTVNRSAAANSWQHFSTRFGSHRPMNCCNWHKFSTLFIYIDIYRRFEITTSDSRVFNSFAKLGQHGESQPPDFRHPSWKVRRHRDLNFNSSLGWLNESTTSEGTLMPNAKKPPWSGNPQGVAKSSTQTSEQQR